MTLSSHQRVQIVGNVVARVVDGEPVLIDLESEVTVSIDPVGVEVWRLVGRGETIASIRQKILDHFDTNEETVRRDLDELIGELAQHGMVRVVG